MGVYGVMTFTIGVLDMSKGNIHKVWGERRRLLLTNKVEIDLLYLHKDCFCSTHRHVDKINVFT